MKIEKTKFGVVCAVVMAAVGGYAVRAARADGVPSAGALTYSGTLEDVVGKPVSGSKMIGVALWDKATAGTGNKVCEAPVASVGVSNGRFDVTLPDTCAAAAKGNANLWIEVTVDSEPLGRTKLGAVPYALEAGAASEAKGALKSQLVITEGWHVVKGVDLLGADNQTTQAWARRSGDTIDLYILTIFSGKPSNTGSAMVWSMPTGVKLAQGVDRGIPGTASFTTGQSSQMQLCTSYVEGQLTRIVMACPPSPSIAPIPAGIAANDNIGVRISFPVEGWGTSP